MRGVWVLLAMSVAGSGVAADKKNRLPEKAANVLAKAKTVELISLLPKRDKGGGFRGWTVLGRTKLTAAKDKKKAVKALRKGIKDSTGKVAKCFDPRHAFSATHDGVIVNVVVCFECYQMVVWVGEERVLLSTTRGPQPALDGILKAAGVKLAPKSKRAD